MVFIEINQHFAQQTNLLVPFITIIAIVWVICVYHSYKKNGVKKTIMYFLPVIIATLFIESIGVASGRYYYPGYIIYLSVVDGGVPLIILLGWSVNLFLFMNIGRHVISEIYQKRDFLQILLISTAAGALGICLDILEDPIAHHNNWWVWASSIQDIKYYNVPLLNFIGWFLLIFFMTMATLLIERSRFSENRKVLISITSISITGTVIFVAHGSILRLLEFAGF